MNLSYPLLNWDYSGITIGKPEEHGGLSSGNLM